MLKKIVWFIFIMGIVLRAVSLQGAGTTGAEFLRVNVPAAASAVGAGTAVESGSNALVWNPAGVLGQQTISLSFTHVASFIDTAYEQLEGVYPDWLGGDWALRFFYASTYDFIEVDEYGDETGALENHDLLFHMAHGRKLGFGIQVGLGLKAFESVLAGYSSQGVALDLGAQYLIDAIPLTLGVSVQNLGIMSAFETEADPLPALLLAGVAVDLDPIPGHELSLRADLQQPLEGDEKSIVLLGLEYSIQELLFIRTGYRLFDDMGTLSVGAGLRYGDLGLDYAYQPYNGLGDNQRFTLTYYIRNELEPEFTPREIVNPESKPTAVEPIVELKVARQVQPQVKSLTTSPRKFEGKLLFKTPDLAPGIKAWTFEIKDYGGKIIKTFSGVGMPPKELDWDGRDAAGTLVTQNKKYQYIFKADEKTVSAHKLPQLQPAVKLQFADKTTIEPGVRFVFAGCPEVSNWRLTIRQKYDRSVVRVISGQDSLPAEVLWDGKQTDGEVADTSLTYEFDLAVAFLDQTEALVSKDIRAIPAKQVTALPGKIGILIYGILFDFNSAVLDPGMTDKCLAAAEIIRRHPNVSSAVCEGHADDIGSIAANLVISKERAHMVANFLAQQPYVSQENISLTGYGMSRPENTLATEIGRSHNRRVEIRLTIPKTK